ncbi:uncharacterized protein LOC111876469 [Lactuca sativa]|uniref:uncharacterized protein LOC111876469 n=1 Tax=Lactuca sativa TaxID=4236 RepID=UPI000CA79B82|nr:uncharacterized protein LOC111876469 [Lactuca sativa]
MGRELETYPSETTTGISKRNNRNQLDDGGGVEWSGKSCRSCTGRVIADCVAVCCCPCAVVNFFTLTFLKLPWMMGKKCLGNMSKKKEKKKLKDEEKDGISRKEKGEKVASGKVNAIGEDDEQGGSRKYSARFEAERVWMELYRVDNLGFGRVSFNGIQSLE